MFTLCYAYPIILFLKRNTFHSRWKSCRGVQVSVLKAVPVSYVIHIKVNASSDFENENQCIRVSNGYKNYKFGGCGQGVKRFQIKIESGRICTFLSFRGVEFQMRYPSGTPTVASIWGAGFWPFRMQEPATGTRMECPPLLVPSSGAYVSLATGFFMASFCAL